MSQTIASGTISPTALISNPHLKQVLRLYQATAMHSLSGPGGNFAEGAVWKPTEKIAVAHQSQSSNQALESSHMSTSLPINQSSSNHQRRPSSVLSSVSLRSPHEEFLVGRRPFPVQAPPVFSQADQSSSEQDEAELEGTLITCFAVGGEKRLVLPQILNTILREKELEDINTVCDDLRIYLPHCTRLQLTKLKESKILPATAPSCNLITLTDAERLCGSLLHRKPDQEFHIANRDKCRQMPVVHRCFGKVRGTCFVDLYGQPDAACIECSGCRGMFSPRHFVLHSDEVKSMESRLCHWGFDSGNWRRYIFIPEEIGQAALEKARPLLEELKRKFDLAVPAANGKRSSIDEQSPFVADARKRIKIEEAVYNHAGMPHYPGPFAWFIPPGGVGGGKGAGDCATGLVTTPADLSVKFRHPQLTVHNLVVSSAAPIPMAHLGRSLPTLVGPTKSSFEKFSDKFSPNVALYSMSSLKSEQRSPTPKAAQNAGGDAQQRPLSRIGEMSAPIPVPGSAARERLHHHSSVQSTSAHAPDRQRGSFLSDSEDAAPVVASAMASKSVEAEDEDDGHSSSSNSTLSTDFVRESAILAVDEEELSNILARTDPETRTRVVREVNRIKHRNEAALRQARQEKVKVEEELKQYKTIATNQTTEIQDLKAAKEKLEVENGRLQVKFSKRWSFSQHEPSSST